MAVKQYLIKFTQKGGKAVQNVFKKIGAAAKKAIPSFKTLNKEIKITKGAMLGVAASAASVGFAMKKVIDLTARSSQIASMTRAFNDLSKGLDFNAKSLDKINRALDGTVNQFDLLKQANNALVLGIAESDDQLAEMFDGAQRLARALGEDALFGVESFVVGVGRQSRMMLDNLGIILDTEKVYQDFADTLGVTVGELTDVEKKTAFNTAAVDALNIAVSKLEPEVLTTADRVKQLGVNFDNTAISITGAFEPAISSALKSLNTFFNAEAIANPDIIAKGGEAVTSLTNQIMALDDQIAEERKPIDLNFSFGAPVDVEKMAELTALETKRIDLQNELTALLQLQADIRENGDFDDILKKERERNAINLEYVEIKKNGEKQDRRNHALKLKNLQEEFLAAALSGQISSKAAKSVIRAETAEAISGYVSGLFQNLHPFVASVLAVGAGAFVGGIIDRNIPEFATGADFIADRPQLGIFGEAGPERVQITPLAGPNINGPQDGGGINITIQGDILDGADFRDKVGEAINMINQGIA